MLTSFGMVLYYGIEADLFGRLKPFKTSGDAQC